MTKYNSNRLNSLFSKLESINASGLGIFITAGDPDFATSLEIMKGLPEAGADMIEFGMPFSDPSGDVLRGWMGLNKDNFYDERNIAIIPMAFCFPGYDDKGSDLPPPKICAKTWRSSILENFQNLELQLLVGSFAQKWHLDTNRSVTDIVKNWRIYSPEILPLPHPSWRNKAWLKKNFWFEEELVPVLRNKVRGILENETA